VPPEILGAMRELGYFGMSIPEEYGGQGMGNLAMVVITEELSCASLAAAGSPDLDAEPVSPDAPAFWLYSSGSTGHPKACVHLQHDMKVCADAYARGVLGIESSDRCFSVARLFFAYGLGNAMYFPLAVGATSILCRSGRSWRRWDRRPRPHAHGTPATAPTPQRSPRSSARRCKAAARWQESGRLPIARS